MTNYDFSDRALTLKPRGKMNAEELAYYDTLVEQQVEAILSRLEGRSQFRQDVTTQLAQRVLLETRKKIDDYDDNANT